MNKETKAISAEFIDKLLIIINFYSIFFRKIIHFNSKFKISLEILIFLWQN
jgi:hypothetical protein